MLRIDKIQGVFNKKSSFFLIFLDFPSCTCYFHYMGIVKEVFLWCSGGYERGRMCASVWLPEPEPTGSSGKGILCYRRNPGIMQTVTSDSSNGYLEKRNERV